jgi:hypothetical protein
MKLAGHAAHLGDIKKNITKYCSKNLKGKDSMGDLDVDRKTI